MNTRPKPLLAIMFLQPVLFFYPFNIEAQETADWWKSHQEVKTVLWDQQIPITEVVAKVTEKRSDNAQDALFKLNILMRAGMNKEAIEALRELKSLNPKMENYQISSIYYDACDDFETWDVAKSTVEFFAENISELTLENRLLKHFARSGWTVEQIDAWLSDKPEGIGNFWMVERLRFNAQHGRNEELIKKLSDDIRSNPQDIEGVVAFLWVLVQAGPREFDALELSWIAETIHPQLATQAYNIAKILKILKQWETAVKFYKQAIEIPVTEAEIKQRSSKMQVAMPTGKHRASLAVNLREEMAECLLKIGKNDEAQKWMEEATAIRKEHNIALNAYLAGQVQNASGQRTIEEQIKEEEKVSEDDPMYWRQRAMYYRGRNEPNQQEESLLRGLALTTPQPRPEHPGKGHQDWRSVILSDYASFLQKQKRNSEVVALLRKEIKETPADTESSERAVRLLAYDFEKHIIADDPVLWNWLSKRQIWENPEARLLWEMLKASDSEHLDKHFSYAETLTQEKDPSRAKTLGWIMNRMNFAQRSIPLLKYAIENTDKKALKESAQFTLFESYLDVGNWQKAEEMFPFACSQLTIKEISNWNSKIAVIAAKSGNQKDAMRLWKQMVNFSPYYIRDLKTLAANGLRMDLAQFYRKMQKELPGSEIPLKALAILEE